jgi:hypothetical protein
MLLCSITVAAQDQFETNYSFIENKGQFNGRNWNNSDPVLYGYNHNPFYVFLSKKGMTYRFDKMIKNPKRKEQPEALPKRVNM